MLRSSYIIEGFQTQFRVDVETKLSGKKSAKTHQIQFFIERWQVLISCKSFDCLCPEYNLTVTSSCRVCLFFWRDILAVQWFGECEDDVLMDEDSLLGSLKAINQYKRPFLK